ncbi:MAG: hypothetical protein ABI606_05320 [Rhodoferax sp.]
MTTVNPTQPMQALRNNQPKRTCQQLGVCLHPDRACPGVCIQAAALQRLAPGVVDGPYTSHPSRGERVHRLIVLGACLIAVVVVLVEIARVLS